MFIPENMKPRVKIVVESYLDDILTFGISTEVRNYKALLVTIIE